MIYLFVYMWNILKRTFPGHVERSTHTGWGPGECVPPHSEVCWTWTFGLGANSIRTWAAASALVPVTEPTSKAGTARKRLEAESMGESLIV